MNRDFLIKGGMALTAVGLAGYSYANKARLKNMVPGDVV